MHKNMNVSEKINKFSVPDYVFPEGQVLPKPKGTIMSTIYGLSELDENTLSALCDQFRIDVFLKAGKVDPSSNIELMHNNMNANENAADLIERAQDILGEGTILDSEKIALLRDALIHANVMRIALNRISKDEKPYKEIASKALDYKKPSSDNIN
jgi:hypothetical protein